MKKNSTFTFRWQILLSIPCLHSQAQIKKHFDYPEDQLGNDVPMDNTMDDPMTNADNTTGFDEEADDPVFEPKGQGNTSSHSDDGSQIADVPPITSTDQTNGQLPDVNVDDVVFVSFGNNTGYFREVEDNKWVEEDANFNTKFRYVEEGRDEKFVYLKDPDRNIKIYLDLYKNEVIFEQPDEEQFVLAGIDMALEEMKGPYTRKVIYTDQQGNPLGLFEKSDGTKKWEEKKWPSGEVLFEFEEVGRDEWTVYLHDASQNKNINLNLYRNWVEYNQDSQEFSDLYQIGDRF